MTRQQVITKAIEGRITWVQAAEVLRLTARQLRRLRQRFESLGSKGLLDGRAGNERKKRIAPAVLAEVCRLKREVYADFSVKHFHEQLTEKHKVAASYTWTKEVLQAAGLVERAPARGKHRRKRERRPMIGMLLHLDASTHEWLAGVPKQDLNVMLDDADGRILFAQFVEQEGTRSTLAALLHVLRRLGRFCEFYTDRGSHFCRTGDTTKGPDEDQHGQVARVLRALGIRHILARSPEARGRSERAFGTLQGRLPQELRVAGVQSYPQANDYLTQTFVPDFNRRFTVPPAQPESAFTPVVDLDLELLLSIQHDRVVRNDNTVAFRNGSLQLPAHADRRHFVRCPVVVHEFVDQTLGITFQGRLLARYSREGELRKGRGLR